MIELIYLCRSMLFDSTQDPCLSFFPLFLFSSINACKTRLVSIAPLLSLIDLSLFVTIADAEDEDDLVRAAGSSSQSSRQGAREHQGRSAGSNTGTKRSHNDEDDDDEDVLFESI